MMRIKNFSRSLWFCALSLTAVLLMQSCATQYDQLLKSTDSALKYQKANEYYANGKYQKAATLYEQAGIFYRGTPQDDTLNFRLAKSYYNMKDAYAAEYYFSQFYVTFPRSPFAEEAYFLRISSLYQQTHRYELDQTPSYKTLSAISDFFYTYPKSNYAAQCNEIRTELTQRLDKKQFEAAKLYYTIENYKSAITALRTSLKDFPETQYKEEILYLLVASSYKYAEMSYRHKQKDRYQLVIDDYYNFVSEFPESKYRKEVENMHADAMEHIRIEQALKAPVKEEVIIIEE